MRIVLLGSGNVATVLGRLFIASGHSIQQVYSRNITHADALAVECDARSTNDLAELDLDADIYLAAISDTALYTIGESLHLKKGLLLHT
ncbi:MAG TPA: NAD(P)-binding domain-containing protein, partial [Flavitalea sp.]|nr:NAD(P)-binding domain-containing protein [Flavitalea sp.]